MLLLSGLTGCVAGPPPPVPLVAVPGPAKTQAEFRQDDAACRAAAVDLPSMTGRSSGRALTTAPGSGSAPVQPAVEQEPAPPPGVTYLRCMAGRNNIVQPFTPPRLAGYGYAPSYGPYDGYGAYPWLYDGAVGFGFYGGCCGGFRGGGYGRRW